MRFLLQHRSDVAASASPYRVIEQDGGEIAWANRFLDMQRVRGLNRFSLRSYGVLDLIGQLDRAQARCEKTEHLLQLLLRSKSGRKSEQLSVDQLALFEAELRTQTGLETPAAHGA